MKYQVYAIGNALVDVEYTVDDKLLHAQGITKGVMTLAEERTQEKVIATLQAHPVKRACGGSAANSIIALQQFGGQGYFCGQIANDNLGQFFLSDLQNTGVHTNMDLGDTKAKLPTGKCVVLITDDADRTMLTHLGTAEHLSAENVSTQAVEASEFVYIEGYMAPSASGREAAIHARTIAQTKNTRFAMSFSDPNMVKFFRTELNAIAGEQIDLLFCNEQEALIWAESTQLAQAIEALKARAKTFVITLGARGALIYDGNTCTTLAGKPVKAIDTLGAGDMFAGAFLYAITHGHNYSSAGELAIAASAELVTSFGARLERDKQLAIREQWQTKQAKNGGVL